MKRVLARLLAILAVMSIAPAAFAQAGTLQLTSATYSVSEGAGFVAVEIVRVGGSVGAINTQITTSDGTATAPADYAAQNVNVTFLDGAVGPAVINIPIVSDTLGEGDETFNVQLTGGPLSAPTSAVVTIVDDEGPVGTLRLSSATYSVSEGAGFVAVQIERVGGSGGTISTQITTSDGTATAPADYAAQNVNVTFLDGAVGPAVINIPIVSDTLGEGDETFNVQLTGGPLSAPTSAVVTIVDDEGPVGTLRLSSATYSVSEGAGFVAVQIERVGGSGGTISTQITTSDGTATAPADYAAQNVNVTFLDGAVGPAVINIPIVSDTLGEGDETLNVQLTGGPLSAPTSAVVTIVDDEGPVGTLRLSSATYSVSEGAGFVAVQIERVGGSGGTISTQITTSDGTATAPADYAAQNVNVTFLDGAVGPAVINIPIVNDALAEGTETFNVQLTGGPTSAPVSAVVSIFDDESTGALQFSAASFRGSEGGSVAVSITRTGGTSGPISATLTTTDGTATAPADYAAQNVLVNFADGDAGPRTILIPLVGDGLDEPAESFTVQLAGAFLGAPAVAAVLIASGAIAVPTLSELGVLLMALALLAAGMSRLRRGRARRRPSRP